MSHNHRPETLAVLRSIGISGEITVDAIERQLPEVEDVQRIVNNLYSHHLVNTERYERVICYVISAKGKRLLARLQRPQMGEMPAPKTSPPSERYKPTPLHTRAGSGDFLNAPSRRGDELVEHRPPISMCGEQVSRV